MRQSRKKNMDQFINEADSVHNTEQKKKTTTSYKIYTFSLDKDTSNKIDNLTLKTRNVRVNRSEIVRAAINYLGKATVEELEHYIIESKVK